jgi:hypothetical protein
MSTNIYVGVPVHVFVWLSCYLVTFFFPTTYSSTVQGSGNPVLLVAGTYRSCAFLFPAKVTIPRVPQAPIATLIITISGNLRYHGRRLLCGRRLGKQHGRSFCGGLGIPFCRQE